MIEHLLREIVSFVTVQPPQFHEITKIVIKNSNRKYTIIQIQRHIKS